MDVKRPLLTQVPSQMDVGIKKYDYYSSRIGLRFEFDGYEEATFVPSSVSNRCCDQKLACVARDAMLKNRVTSYRTATYAHHRGGRSFTSSFLCCQKLRNGTK
eukprot:scaffold121818_cov32-Attheya_sp.AAC.2